MTRVDMHELVRDQPAEVVGLQAALVCKGRHGLQRIVE
jgi:hypothetical protein